MTVAELLKHPQQTAREWIDELLSSLDLPDYDRWVLSQRIGRKIQQDRELVAKALLDVVRAPR